MSLPVCLCVCFPLHNPTTLHATQVRILGGEPQPRYFGRSVVQGVPLSGVSPSNYCRKMTQIPWENVISRHNTGTKSRLKPPVVLRRHTRYNYSLGITGIMGGTAVPRPDQSVGAQNALHYTASIWWSPPPRSSDGLTPPSPPPLSSKSPEWSARVDLFK